MLAQTDKGKTTVIINYNEYSKKVHTFLADNLHLHQKRFHRPVPKSHTENITTMHPNRRET